MSFIKTQDENIYAEVLLFLLVGQHEKEIIYYLQTVLSLNLALLLQLIF